MQRDDLNCDVQQSSVNQVGDEPNCCCKYRYVKLLCSMTRLRVQIFKAVKDLDFKLEIILECFCRTSGNAQHANPGIE